MCALPAKTSVYACRFPPKLPRLNASNVSLRRLYNWINCYLPTVFFIFISLVTDIFRRFSCKCFAENSYKHRSNENRKWHWIFAIDRCAPQKWIATQSKQQGGFVNQTTTIKGHKMTIFPSRIAISEWNYSRGIGNLIKITLNRFWCVAS